MQTSRYNKLLICHQPNFGTGWQDLKGWCPKQLLKVLISIRFWPAKYAILWALQLAKDLEITPRKWWGSAWQCQREVTLLTITALTTMIKTPHIYIYDISHYVPLYPYHAAIAMCLFLFWHWLSHEVNGKRIASSLDPLDCCQRPPQAGHFAPQLNTSQCEGEKR